MGVAGANHTIFGKSPIAVHYLRLPLFKTRKLKGFNYRICIDLMRCAPH